MAGVTLAHRFIGRVREAGVAMNTVYKPEDPESSLYESVLADISSGALEGGQRLKVVELAQRYGVSTSPVREVSPRRSTVSTPPPQDKSVRPSQSWLKTDASPTTANRTCSSSLQIPKNTDRSNKFWQT